jgi:hypothetical protein
MLPSGGVALRPSGTERVVAETGNHRLRRIVLAADGTPLWITTLAGSDRAGSRDGPADQADLELPLPLRSTPDGHLLVLDGRCALRLVP